MRIFGCCVLLTYMLVYVNGQDGDNLMLPNERTTLDDCHLRFHLMDPDVPVKPAFGHPARLKEFAHMGAIGWIQPDGTIEWRCGGTLIWDNFVLTAAHCVIDSNNNPPDVIRFGDLDLSSTKDDEYAQQLRIVEIIRHPEHRFTGHYNDIALLRLQKNVVLHDTVSPACLWTDEEVRFKILEATGWGKTGFAEAQTPVLLKVALKPLENSECKQFYTKDMDRKLRNGLQAQHICAVDEKMDTCEGDSGGPLQIKLLHNGLVTPFVVGITSFGTTCGTSFPGVYTRVSPYHSWIIDVMKKRGANVDGSTYNATLCAIRYSRFREYEDAIILSRTVDYVSIDSSKVHMRFAENLPPHMAKLIWRTGGHDNCYGIIIDDDTVLTVASCASYRGTPVSSISYDNNNERKVSKVIIHPNHVHGSGYNNIAVLRLEKFVDVSKLQPSCIWVDHQYPAVGQVTIFGFGRRDINTFMRRNTTLDSTIVNLGPRADVQNLTDCLISKRYLPQLQRGLTREHVCSGNSIFLVPDSCDLMIGGPLHTDTSRFWIDYPMTIAINEFGRDCGFGEHAIAVGFAAHAEWLKTVLIPNYREPSSALQFVDRNRQDGDSCSSFDGSAARCVPLAMCLREWNFILSSKSTKFCSTSSVICCPLNEIKSTIHPELASCPDFVKNLDSKNPAGSQVFLGWKEGRTTKYSCHGVIITKSVILTSASCLRGGTPHVVQLVSNTSNVLTVEASLSHPAYNNTDGSNDIALVRIRRSLQFNSDTFPACLWTNTNNAPLRTQYVSGDARGNVTYEYAHPMYNSDCQRSHPYLIRQSQICAKKAKRVPLCAYPSAQLQWAAPDGVTYIVGLAVAPSNCQNWSYSVFTRVSSFVSWIGKSL